MSLDQGASAFMEQAASAVQCSPVGSRRLFSLSRRYSTGDLRALAPSRPRYSLGADWMLSVRLLATNGYEFLPRDGAGYDGGQRSTRCNREIGGKCSRLRCAIALRVPVAELVGGLVGMPREAPQGAEESFGVLTADTRESRDVCLSTERVEVVWQLFACRKRQTQPFEGDSPGRFASAGAGGDGSRLVGGEAKQSLCEQVGCFLDVRGTGLLGRAFQQDSGGGGTRELREAELACHQSAFEVLELELPRFGGHLQTVQRRCSQWQRHIHRMRRSSGARWSSWSARAVRRGSWHASSGVVRRRSVTGSVRATAMKGVVMTD